MLRTCHCCLKIKELNKFSKNKYGKFGRRSQCKECDTLYHKKHYENNKFKLSKQAKLWVSKHLKQFRSYQKSWRRKNISKLRVYHKKYAKNKRHTDAGFKIAHNLRVRISQALKYNYKSLDTFSLIGCDKDYLMYHLQKQFKAGMSWDNYGKWHIDHIKPCAKFDLSKISEQRKCFHYRNLQPLWAHDNQIKSWK